MKSNLYKILHVITSMKIRVTIDLDKADESISILFSEQSMTMGVFGCDKDGAYHMYFHSRTDLVSFEDVKVLKN